MARISVYTRNGSVMKKHDSVSIDSIEHIEEPGWGLREEDLERIIRSEKLRDVTSRFSSLVKCITEDFDFVPGIRIVAFDKSSGLNKESRAHFRSQIREGRQIVYHAGLSNRETCAVLASSTSWIDDVAWPEHFVLDEWAQDR